MKGREARKRRKGRPQGGREKLVKGKRKEREEKEEKMEERMARGRERS